MTDLLHTWTPANHYAPILALAGQSALINASADRTAWDKAFGEWARCDALVQADIAYGPIRRAFDAHDMLKAELIAKHGREFMRTAQARSELEESLATVRSAEEAQIAILEPLWAAQRNLFTTPAPDLAAVAFKHELAAREELDNDGNLEAEPFDIISADLARLEGEAA